tara:strand:+ start:1667 stop:1816 length:150 start_codon:yes stop_codon:yes gene_type:complete
MAGMALEKVDPEASAPSKLGTAPGREYRKLGSFKDYGSNLNNQIDKALL